jgi:RNase P subunit RPR2
MVITSSEAQTKTKLDHLWRLSHTVVSTVPQLSVHYQEVLHRIAAADHQTIADATQRRCCIHCGVPRVPGQTSHIRVSQRKSRKHPHHSTLSTGKVETDTNLPATHKPKTTNPSSHFQYIGRPLDQRPKGQSIRLHSARDIDVTCLMCGGIARYGGATREELRKISASSAALNMKRQSRKRKRQPTTVTNPVQFAPSSMNESAKQTHYINKHSSLPNDTSTPVTGSIDMVQSSKAVSSNLQQKKQTGQHRINQKANSSAEIKSSNTSTKHVVPTVKKHALPSNNRQVKQKRDKKSGKKHALGKLLDKERQQRNDENAKKNVSLNDFLMDFN